MTYFKPSEFTCRGGCGGSNISAKLIERLDMARGVAGVPFVITSGYRCPKHNKAVGGKPTSSHLKGLAVDIATPDSPTRFAVVRGLLKAGFTRLGVGEGFVHADIDTSKPSRVMWMY